MAAIDAAMTDAVRLTIERGTLAHGAIPAIATPTAEVRKHTFPD